MTDDAALLGVGDELPTLVLSDDRGEPVHVRSIAEDQTLILFFYPKDSGIFCRTQACALRDSWPLLRAEGIAVYGVNGGSADGHARFRVRYDLPFPLLVDEGLALARKFGFVREWVPGSLPRAVERSTVIVDPGGRIRSVLRNVKASAHFDMLRVDLGLPERVAEPEAVVEEPAAAVEPEAVEEPANTAAVAEAVETVSTVDEPVVPVAAAVEPEPAPAAPASPDVEPDPAPTSEQAQSLKDGLHGWARPRAPEAEPPTE